MINSWIHDVSVQCQSPIRIIDSEIHELYADESDVEQVGSTEVTHSMPFLQHNQWVHDMGRGPDIAYRSHMSLDKNEYQLGEPVNVTISIENLGFQPFTLYFNGTDRFSFSIKWLNESAISEDGWIKIASYSPDHSVLPPQVEIESGEVTEFTLTWYQDPPVPPGKYAIECTDYFTTLRTQFRVGYHKFTITDEYYYEAG